MFDVIFNDLTTVQQQTIGRCMKKILGTKQHKISSCDVENEIQLWRPKIQFKTLRLLSKIMKDEFLLG